MNNNLKIGKYHSCDYLGDNIYLGLDTNNLFWLFIYVNIHIKPLLELKLSSDNIDCLLLNLRKYGWK